MMSLGPFGGLEVPPALAVPCGLASAASFVCIIIDSSFIANLQGMASAGVMSFGPFGGLEVLPALAVPCGLASAASFVCVVIVSSYSRSPRQGGRRHDVQPGSSGLIWAALGSSGLIWAHLGSSGLIWAQACDVFSVVRHSRMWCPHDIGRDSWVWGKQETLWMMNSPHEVGEEALSKRSSLSGGNGWPVDKMIVIVVVFVESY